MTVSKDSSALSGQIADALARVRDQKSFLHHLLIGALKWEIPERSDSVEDIAFAWSEDDLRAPGIEKKLGKALQIQPLHPNSLWGIFVLEFKEAKLFTTGRGLTGPLRRVLRGLVPKQRGQSHLPAWKREHLLFLCTHEYMYYRFAYFKSPTKDDSQTAPLAFFGWDPDQPARTVCEFNLPWLEWPESALSQDEWVQQWASAFDVERVTKRFYEDYADIFEALRPLCGLKDMDESKLFTQLLLNRLLFLRFLERKGWLLHKGRTDYLQALFAEKKTKPGKTSFYRDWLRPLFFEYLAQDVEHPANGFGKVPFLNGGLFEEGDLDRKVQDLPDSAFAGLLEPEGLLYRYNFTVEESTPLDIDVAVDPEMLGKVFEKLVTGRHETGSYYTPRTVVSFMCREALKDYLAARTDATTESLAALVDQGRITGLTTLQGQAIVKALDDLKAVDPACGSGAYLLGLLQEMVALYRRLFSGELVADPRRLHALKLRIISHNLYGVDIDPFATNLAMLRLWLSLAVEAEHPLPLPNLDFKIKTGDSVLGPCEIDPTTFDFRELVQRADILVEWKDQYLQSHGTKRNQLRRHIGEEEHEIERLMHLTTTHRGINWRIQFAEVLGKNRGFDIVLANPPYVRQELITDSKPAFKHNFDYIYQGAADLYVYFYARGVELLRPGGILAFIAPNKFFRAGYGKKLRSFLGRNTRLRALLDFGDFPIFEAITYPSIVVLEKNKPLKKDSLVETCNWHADGDLNQLGGVFHEKASHLAQSQFSPEIWNIQDAGTTKTMEAIKIKGTPLTQFIKGKLFYGIKTGCNEAFEIDEATKEELCKKDPKSAEIIRPWLRGRNINRWKVDWQSKYLIFARRGININQYSAVKKHLEKFREMLEPRPAHVAVDDWPGRKPGSYKWYEVQDAIDYWPEFEHPKIVYQVIATYQQFAFTDEPFVTNDKAWIMPNPQPGLLAILNSKVAWFFLDKVTAKLQGGAFELRSPYMSQIPIVAPSKDLIAKEKAILTLAQRGDAKSDQGKALERDIDDIVVRLYGLGKKDIQVIDEALAICGNRFPFKETDEYKEYMRARYGEDEE